MKKSVISLLLTAVIFSCSTSDSIFVFESAQSMSITGKGPGQDAAINPYSGQNSISVVKNLGSTSVGVRIQNNGTIIEDYQLKPKDKKEFPLNGEDELYLDSNGQGKVRVTFEKTS